MKVCVINSGSTVLTIPRVISLGNRIKVSSFIELGKPINEHGYIEEGLNIQVKYFQKTSWTHFRLSVYLSEQVKDVYLVFYTAGIPLIASLLANDKPVIGVCMGSDIRFSKNWLDRWLKTRMWKQTDLLIAKSKNLSEFLTKQVSHRTDISVNYWGIDTNFFGEVNKQKARENLQLPSASIILSPRAFSALYSIDLIVESFIRYKKIVPDGFLLLIGRQTDKSVITAAREKLSSNRLIEGKDFRIDGNIEYNGISEYYYASDVAVSFAKTEGFPTTLFELFYCGCPVLVGDIPSFKSEILENEENVIFSNFNSAEIAKHLLNLCTSKGMRSKLIAGGKELYNEYGRMDDNSSKVVDDIKSIEKKKWRSRSYLFFLAAIYSFSNKIR